MWMPRSACEQMLPGGAAGGPGLPDAELLHRFVQSRDEAAFEVLVWRHGPLVLSACRRLLRREQDVEDAFQATFLTLARKAGAISRGASVSAWLYQVAYRIALRILRYRSPQPLGENADLVFTADTDPTEQLAAHELKSVIDEEVNRLPEKYRAVVVLCYLNGKTNEAAARELGCPKGTVLSRLARARDRLRQRLEQRGFGAGLLSDFFSEQAGQLATVSPPLIHATVHLAILAPLTRLAAGMTPSPAVELAESVMQQMWLARVQALAGRVAAVSLVCLMLLAVFWNKPWERLDASELPSSNHSAPANAPGTCHP
jgi:RNA polymerase sigma factor (sigma-70 family)